MASPYALPGVPQVLFVLSGPSGSGKETVMKAMVERVPHLQRIITYTTRAPRPGEVEGQHYHFVSDQRFRELLTSGTLFESEAVYGSSRYGSPALAVEGTSSGDLIMELDPHGFRRMREARRDPTVGIFLLAPSAGELERRIRARAAESDLSRRLKIAREQLDLAGDYEYQVVNNDLGTCLDDVAAIIRAERLRRRGLANLARSQQDFGS